MKTGIELITEERLRQISVEGWTAEHDDQHANGELAEAARGYLHELMARKERGKMLKSPPPNWPWDVSWWKPTENPIGELVKAGALIAAEIDRLQRKQEGGK